MLITWAVISLSYYERAISPFLPRVMRQARGTRRWWWSWCWCCLANWWIVLLSSYWYSETRGKIGYLAHYVEICGILAERRCPFDKRALHEPKCVRLMGYYRTECLPSRKLLVSRAFPILDLRNGIYAHWDRRLYPVKRILVSVTFTSIASRFSRYVWIEIIQIGIS